MYKFLENEQVMMQEKGPTFEVWKPIGMKNKNVITPDKLQIVTNEIININLQWKTFDIEHGEYVNSNSTDDFKIDINGDKSSIASNNGQATITFTSEIPGEYVINGIRMVVVV